MKSATRMLNHAGSRKKAKIIYCSHGGGPLPLLGDAGHQAMVAFMLKLMYPEADIPALQLSLLRGLDPAKHLALGRALRELLAENILVVGSGFSFHNMRAFAWNGTSVPDSAVGIQRPDHPCCAT